MLLRADGAPAGAHKQVTDQHRARAGKREKTRLSGTSGGRFTGRCNNARVPSGDMSRRCASTVPPSAAAKRERRAHLPPARRACELITPLLSVAIMPASRAIDRRRSSATVRLGNRGRTQHFRGATRARDRANARAAPRRTKLSLQTCRGVQGPRSPGGVVEDVIEINGPLKRRETCVLRGVTSAPGLPSRGVRLNRACGTGY